MVVRPSASTPQPAPRPTPVLTWVAIGLALLSLALIAWTSLQGADTDWWAWALPLLVIANASVGSLHVLRRWPRIEKVFPWVTVVLALWVIVALALYLQERIAAKAAAG
jgi:hypothetical protein